MKNKQICTSSSSSEYPPPSSSDEILPKRRPRLVRRPPPSLRPTSSRVYNFSSAAIPTSANSDVSSESSEENLYELVPRKIASVGTSSPYVFPRSSKEISFENVSFTDNKSFPKSTTSSKSLIKSFPEKGAFTIRANAPDENSLLKITKKVTFSAETVSSTSGSSIDEEEKFNNWRRCSKPRSKIIRRPSYTPIARKNKYSRRDVVNNRGVDAENQIRPIKKRALHNVEGSDSMAPAEGPPSKSRRKGRSSFMCEPCKKEFKSKYALYGHMNSFAHRRPRGLVNGSEENHQAMVSEEIYEGAEKVAAVENEMLMDEGAENADVQEKLNEGMAQENQIIIIIDDDEDEDLGNLDDKTYRVPDLNLPPPLVD